MAEWERPLHDTVVREIASAGSPQRGRLLINLLDKLDPLVWSQAIDEIGMTGDVDAARPLLSLAAGELPEKAQSYVRVKAIEALGRLRASFASQVLRQVVETKQFFRWVNPNELRIVAFQGMQRIDPEWSRHFLPSSGLAQSELALAPLDPQPETSWVRQRRYLRVPLPRVMSAFAETNHGEYRVSTTLLSLGGGMAACEQKLAAGTQALLKLGIGLRPLRARVLMRRAGPQLAGFEIVDMELEERSKLRRLLASLGRSAAPLNISRSPTVA
jgi:hypothetical protein